MTGIELPIAAAIGIISTVAGAGGAYAGVKHKTREAERDIAGLQQELTDHKKDDARMHGEILRALGRIEGTLTEMSRSK